MASASQLVAQLGVSCVIVIGTASAQSPEPQTAEEYRAAAIEKLEKIQQKSKNMSSFAKTGNELEEQVRQLKKDAEAAAKRAPPMVSAPPRTSEVVVPPAVLEQDGLERLRRNQRALTDQRIGDILILRTD